MITAKNIHYSYDNLKVLKGIDLNIKKGEFVCIIGASGTGKTTLLQILGTLEKIQRGTLEINNKNTNKLSDQEISKLRNQEIGFVFQFHNLLNEFTALENICLPAYLYRNTSVETIKQKALEILKMLNIQHRDNHKTDELSGGEQQRIAVARALINSPSIILADEPSGNLDSKNATELHHLLLKLNKEKNQTIVVTTHNKDLAKLSDRILEISDGKII
tara:strand:+ start:1372 stop:2025 length:654 start_codon:yes stop_codon:yes gene_type:complete